MKLEQQVCSLDLAKLLKELGVKQDSLFWWNNGLKTGSWNVFPNRNTNGLYGNWTSAFTVAELGEMLPITFGEEDILGGYSYNQHIYTPGGIRKWGVSYTDYKGEVHGMEYEEVSEADARAKMLVYLLENKLITL